MSIFVLVAGGALLGVVLGLHRHRAGPHHHNLIALIALLATLVLLLAGAGFLLWHVLDRPAYRGAMQYPWRRRMRVAKALRRGHPVAPEDEEVADAVVALMRQQKAIYWFQPVMIATWVLMAFIRTGTARWLYAGYAVLMVPLVLFALRVRRRTIRNWETSSNRPGNSQGSSQAL